MAGIRQLNYRLFLVLLVSLLIPAVYSTVRVNFLGSLPETWGFNIASQIAWLNLFYEVLSEGLLLPLYFIFGQVIKDRKQLSDRFAFSLWVMVLSYGIVSALVYQNAYPIVGAMGQSGELLEATVSYIRLETIAILLSSVYAMVSVIWVTLKLERLMYVLLALKTLLTIFFDSVLISQLSISYQLGVNGVAWTNIIVNGVMVAVSLAWLLKNHFSLIPSFNRGCGWVKHWASISVKSGLESLIRNLAFMFMILKMVNEVHQQGTFWVTNQFIWGWLLLPVLALGNLIKQDCSSNQGELGKRFSGYLQLTSVIAIIWLLTMPLWEGFIGKIMGVPEAHNVYQLSVLLLAFYIIFAFNNVLDSYFYGVGRTDLMLYQSVIVNSVFYGGAYLLYLYGYYVPTLTSIAVMFGLGITCDALVTLILFVQLQKQMLAQKSSGRQQNPMTA